MTRTRGVVVPLPGVRGGGGTNTQPDTKASSVARALYVVQRTLDDGLPAEEVGAWYERRDASARELLAHLDPAVTCGEAFDERVSRLVTWLEHGTRRRPEGIVVYARTLCVPHIGGGR